MRFGLAGKKLALPVVRLGSVKAAGSHPGTARPRAWLESLARISHTREAHLANHLAAGGFVLPHRITFDRPWSSSPPGD